MSKNATTARKVSKTHVSHPSLKLLEELAGGKEMANFWETMSKDPELVYYQRPKKAKRKRRRKKKVRTADKMDALIERTSGEVKDSETTGEDRMTEIIIDDDEDSLPSVEELVPVQLTLPVAKDNSDNEKVAEETEQKEDSMVNASLSRDSLPECKDAGDRQLGSSLKVPGEPSFQGVFFPTADTHIREFSFIDLDDMVAQLQEEVANEERGNTPKVSDMVENLADIDDVTEKDEKVMEIVMPTTPKANEKSTEYTVTWDHRPLGIEVVRGPGGLNAWVRRIVDKSLLDKIVPGSFIMSINDQYVFGESYSRILKIIGRVKEKVTLVLNENPKLEPMIPVGSMVRLKNLNRETRLNGCVGFVFSEMVDGRYPIKLAEHGDQIGVRPKNIILLEEATQVCSENPDQETFDFSGTYELVKTIGMSKFLRSQGMSWFKTKLRSNPKLSMMIKQDGTTFKMVFSSPKGALTDEFVANKSSFRGQTWRGSVAQDDSNDVASKTAVIIGQRLEITEVTKLGEKKKIVFSQKDANTMVLEVVNNLGAQMVQEFRRIQS